MGKKAKRKKHLTPVVGNPGKNNNKFLTDDDRVFIDEQVAKHKKEIERMREELEKLKNQKLFTPIELGKKRIYFALLRFEFWHPISDNPDKEFKVFYKEISSLIRKAGEDLHKYAGVAEMASDKLWRFIPEFYRPLVMENFKGLGTWSNFLYQSVFHTERWVDTYYSYRAFDFGLSPFRA